MDTSRTANIWREIEVVEKRRVGTLREKWINQVKNDLIMKGTSYQESANSSMCQAKT